MVEVHVVAVSWESHKEALIAIRTSVFVEEQKIPRDTEFDGEDETAIHLIALDSTGKALGCARLLDSGLIGRVAVIESERGRGLGVALMDAAVNEAQAKGITLLQLHAQESAQAFYRKLEFVPTGVQFVEAGIPHVTMERALPIPFDTSGISKSTIVRTRTKTRSPGAEQQVSRLREFADEGTALEQLHEVLAKTRRTLSIYSPTLDHALFDSPRTVEFVSELARSAPGVQINILIKDSSLIVSRGHLLVELGRRLEQKMAIRKLPETIKADAQSWLIADNSALWVQSEPTDYQGWSDTFNPVQAERFAKRYTHLWDRSMSDPELRLLRI